MFLYQKYKYNYKHLEGTKNEVITEIKEFLDYAKYKKVEYTCYDTETTGLQIIKSVPFLVSMGAGNRVITFDYNADIVNETLRLIKKIKLEENENYIGLLAHNAKFDWHMLKNGGSPIPDDLLIGDSMTIARLTEYADTKNSLSLAAIGGRYVDDTAKFAGNIIKDLIQKENKERKKYLRELMMDNFPDDGLYTLTKKNTRRGTKKLTDLINDYDKHYVPYVEQEDNKYYEFIKEHYTPANYEDIYKQEPLLMRSYACDDVVIMLEYLKKAVPVLRKLDTDLKVFKREGKLISAAGTMERTGLALDIDYVIKSRKKMITYRSLLYFELNLITDIDFSVGQHSLIKRIFKNKYGITLQKSDEKAIKEVRNTVREYIKNVQENETNEEILRKVKKCKDIDKVCSNIIELRTADKWLSTYIDGKLKDLVNGRIYSDFKLTGAVSGRVSSNMQQQPKEAFYDDNAKKVLLEKVELGEIEEGSEEFYKELEKCEIFHPRRAFKVDEGTSLVFIDMSQMELRMQAYYTILTAREPDLNLCRAYIPYKCKHYLTGKEFDFTNIDDLEKWDEVRSECPDINSFKEGIKDALIDGWSIWERIEDGKPWHLTDLHSETTSHAFPNIEQGTKEFKKKRKLGKVCNFLKVYQGGVRALQDALDIDLDTANTLDKAFYKAFPRIQDYQYWVNDQMTVYGFVENLYGRRFYMTDSQAFYKVCNYLIQGSCADMVKQFEINLYNYIKENNLKTKMVLPIHDEVVFNIPNDELHIIGDLKAIMEDTYDVVKSIPMIADVEISETNWAEKRDYYVER